MFLRIVHLTRYDYSLPVSFAPHAFYLRPRETSRQRLHNFSFNLAPAARLVATTDPLDNALDWAYFAPESIGTRLEAKTELMVETLDTNPFDFFLKSSAFTFPFTYDPAEHAALTPNLTLRPATSAAQLREWFAQHVPTPPPDTVAFLTALNTAVLKSLRYTRRDEEGIQSVGDTLARGSGSCRDFAVFFIELCRTLGLAARFVSGYLYEPPAADPAAQLPCAMHAWAEVYLPGAGWRGLDPTRGIFCDDAYVPVAHAAVAESVNPIQGAFFASTAATSTLVTTLTVEKL